MSDITGLNCNKNQTDQRVWFLAGTFGGRVLRKCEIPFGRSILFPVIADLISFAEFDFKTKHELRGYAKHDLDQTKNMMVELDKFQIGTEKYRVQTDLFEFYNAKGDPTGMPSGFTRGVSDGYWVFLHPLYKGNHTIHFEAEKPRPRNENKLHNSATSIFSINVTYKITVK